MTNDAPVAFIHLPRTGGTSFGAALRARYGRQSTCKVKGEVVDSAVAAAIQPAARVIYGHMNYGLHVHMPVRYATVLRDPVARIVSHHGLLRLKTKRHGAPAPSFEAFVQSPKWHNAITQILAGTRSAFAASDADLGLAKRHLEQFAYVGFFDRLDLFGAALGVDDVLPHVNGSRKVAMDDAMTETIRHLNARDVELYGWAKERFAASSPFGLHGPDHVVGPRGAPAQPPLALMLSPLAAPGFERAIVEACGGRAVPIAADGPIGPGIAALIDPDTEILFGDMLHGLHRFCPVRYATVLRDPLERTVAILEWLCARTPAPERTNKVDEFLAEVANRDPLTRQLAGGPAGDPADDELARAKRHLDHFEFVAFTPDLGEASARLGIPPLPPPRPVNLDAWSAWSDPIRDLNRRDIELYQWARRRFPPGPA